MFLNPTERARNVIALARWEGQRLGSDAVGTEHLLLAILQEGGGIAARLRDLLHVEPNRIREGIQKLKPVSLKRAAPGESLPFSARSRHVMELAGEAAEKLGHREIGIGHLFLGLLQEEAGLAARILVNLGLDLKAARKMVLEALSPKMSGPPPAGPR
ncbi:MAG TPA: Clp protease N-terminal domain-containing protein [Planctomycetota bacterium]|jgi:ATP-dependent Clp protease ATP-binding subunit ClpC